MYNTKIREQIYLATEQIKKMKIELSNSKGDYNFKAIKNERIIIFESLIKKLLQEQRTDLLLEISEGINNLQKRDVELDGLIIKINFTPDAKKQGWLVINFQNQ